MNDEVEKPIERIDPRKPLWIFIMWCKTERIVPREIIKMIVARTPYEYKDNDGYSWTFSINRGVTGIIDKNGGNRSFIIVNRSVISTNYTLPDNIHYWWSRHDEVRRITSNMPGCPVCKLPCMDCECEIHQTEFLCPEHGRFIYW